MYVNLYIIFFPHNRYTRTTINITHNLFHETNQLHPKSDINQIKKNVENRLRLGKVKQGIGMHCCGQVFSVVTDKYLLNGSVQ